MALNNVRFFADEDNFIELDTSGAVNNVIKIGYLKFSKPSDKTNKNHVYCSFQGSMLNQVSEDVLDEAVNEGGFCYVSGTNNENVIKIAVNKSDVDSIEKAKKYIQGLLIDYELAPLSPAGSNKEPLFEVSTYLSDGTLVSPTVACSLNDIAKKIIALENNFDTNRAGFYKHVVQRSLVQK